MIVAYGRSRVDTGFDYTPCDIWFNHASIYLGLIVGSTHHFYGWWSHLAISLLRYRSFEDDVEEMINKLEGEPDLDESREAQCINT